jgi:prefoldin subunit 5
MQLFLLRNDSEKRKIYIPNEVLTRNDNVAALRESVSGGNILTLDTDSTAKLQLGQTFASVTQITTACYAIKRTQFNQVTPKPDWYDALNVKFQDVKQLANQWVDDYAVTLRTVIPSSIITYVPVFKGITDVILGIVSKGDSMTPSDMASVRGLLEKLLTKTNKVYDEMKVYACCEKGEKGDNKVTGKLVDWASDMEAAQGELNAGVDSIQNSIESLEEDIKNFKGAISALEADISRYNKFVSLGAGLVGGGAFIGIVGAGACFIFPAIGGIMIAVGVASVIGGAATWGVFQQKINDANAQITQYRSNIKSSQQAVVALSGLDTSVNLVVNSAQAAVNNMITFSSEWATFGQSVYATIQALDEGKTDSINDLAADINIALGQWETVKTYAQELLDGSQTIQDIPASQAA